MKFIYSFAKYAVVLLVLTPLAGLTGARADDADLAQVLKTLKALESRVATLESEKQHYRREAASARAETQALKQKLGQKPNAAPSPALPAALPLQLPSDSYAMATKGPVPPAVPTWGGFYAGASFGVASFGGNTNDVAPRTTTTVAGLNGPNPFTTVTTDTFTSNLSGRSPGAMANLYLGYDYTLTSNILLGAQIEGSLSRMRAIQTGPGSDPSQTTQTAGVVSTTSVLSSQQFNQTTLSNLDNRWAVSALARGGWVADPKDLFYLIGGVTYGRFDAPNTINATPSFGAFGGTIGAGFERKIAPSWTLKAEYRYTRFEDITYTRTPQTSTTSFDQNGNVSRTIAVSSVDNLRLSGVDWHAVSIGVSHYFDF